MAAPGRAALARVRRKADIRERRATRGQFAYLPPLICDNARASMRFSFSAHGAGAGTLARYLLAEDDGLVAERPTVHDQLPLMARPGLEEGVTDLDVIGRPVPAVLGDDRWVAGGRALTLAAGRCWGGAGRCWGGAGRGGGGAGPAAN
jgi:hypothetical protein